MKRHRVTYNYPITERQFAIIAGKADDATKEEINIVISRLSYFHKYDLANQARENNWEKLDNWMSRCCKRFEITPKEHKITKGTFYVKKGSIAPPQTVFIDGLPELVYDLLFYADSSNKSLRYTIPKVRNYLYRTEKYDAVLLLELKFSDLCRELELDKLHSWDLDKNTEYTVIHNTGIDGISISHWKALNVDDFFPGKSHLIHWIKEHDENGEIETAEFLRKKYKEYLLPKNYRPPTPAMERSAAIAFRNHILSPEYRQQLMDKYRGMAEDGDNSK